ncbi:MULTISPECIES: hypothetical protein [Caulobacter]|nr:MULTISPECIES: hypothetical protein [Caulobacter]MBQ1562242.1 hypothetical protein [Caulobacter sp.]
MSFVRKISRIIRPA